MKFFAVPPFLTSDIVNAEVTCSHIHSVDTAIHKHWCEIVYVTRFAKRDCIPHFEMHILWRSVSATLWSNVFYKGHVAATMQKWSLKTAPAGCYGGRIYCFYDHGEFLKNDTTMKACFPGMEGASDSYCGMELVVSTCIITRIILVS